MAIHCPAGQEVLEKYDLVAGGNIIDAVAAFRSAKQLGVWAMYENEASHTESMVGSTLQSTEEQWCLTALRLADEPNSLDGF